MAAEPKHEDEAPIRPCPAAMGIIGVPARRWNTKADLYAQIEQARRFLDECPLEGVSVKDAAKEVGMSLHHFIRLFHEIEGRTPLQYLNARRVSKAAHLLETTRLSVGEIAFEVGLGSASALGRTFRKARGMTPIEHRKNLASSVEHSARRAAEN